MAEASFNQPLHALAAAGLRPGAQPRRGHGWEFIDLAALGDNRARCYLIGLLRLVLYPFGFAVVAGLGIGVAIGVTAGLTHKPPPGVGQTVGLLFALALVIAAGGAVLRTVVRTHRRPWMSLVAPDLRLDWRRLAIGGGVEAALMLGQLSLAHALTGQPWGSISAAQLPLLALIFVLVPFQAASEEILFRGYLTQAFGRIFVSRPLIAVAVAVLFGLVHLNSYGPVSVPYFILLSLVYSLVSLRDGRLELTIGAHAAMNLSALVVANAMLAGGGGDHAGSGAALPAVALTWAALAILAIRGGLFYGLSRLLVRLFCERGRAA